MLNRVNMTDTIAEIIATRKKAGRTVVPFGQDFVTIV
jgi:hypothetical protein